jgi:membrane protease YdiL (CAAX protease family)
VTRATRVEGTVLTLCIAAFCLAMGLREVLNIWIGTGSAAVISILLLRRLSSPPSLQANEDPVRSGITGLLVGLAMSMATWVLYPISIDFVPAIGVEVTKLYGLLRQFPGPVWAFPVLVMVVGAEELVWRGLAIDLFSKSLTASGAVLLASLVYVLPQIAFRSPLLVIVALLCGLVWGALRVRTHGLLAPLIAHLTWDLLVFVLFPVE